MSLYHRLLANFSDARISCSLFSANQINSHFLSLTDSLWGRSCKQDMEETMEYSHFVTVKTQSCLGQLLEIQFCTIKTLIHFTSAHHLVEMVKCLTF